MNKRLFSLAAMVILSFYSCSSDDENQSSEENLETYVFIPDANFKAALVENTAINTNEDEEISESEAAAFDGNLAINGRNIEVLTGIEAFENIQVLSAFNNAITEVDLSSNLALTQVLLEHNQLTTLDVSMLSLLEDLKVHTNDLQSLNVANGNNENFTRMEAHNNEDLYCIVIDEDFEPTSSWNKDLATNYSFYTCL